MSMWDDVLDSGMFGGTHRFADGARWEVKKDGITASPPRDGIVTRAAAEIHGVFGWWGDHIRAASAQHGVPVEYLAALAATETRYPGVTQGAAEHTIVHMSGFTNTQRTPELAAAGCTVALFALAQNALRRRVAERDLFNPAVSFDVAAVLINAQASHTRFQPPLVVSAYNLVSAPLLDQSSAWRLRSWNGDQTRIGRYCGWFNAAVAAVRGDPHLAGASPAAYKALDKIQAPAQGTAATEFKKPESLVAIQGGLRTTSTNNELDNRVWALDATTLDQIASVARDAASGLGLPMGLPTFSYPDAAGVPRTMSGTEIQALYKAMRDFIAGVRFYDADRLPSLPSATVSLD